MCLAPLPICIFKKWVRTSHAAFLLALISKSSTCLVSEPHTLLQKNYGCRRQGTLKIQSINYGSSELFVTEGSLYFPVTGCKYKWKNNSKFNYSPPPLPRIYWCADFQRNFKFTSVMETMSGSLPEELRGHSFSTHPRYTHGFYL